MPLSLSCPTVVIGELREGQEGEASLSVMPDGFNRASRVLSLLPVKMDSRLKLAGMTREETAGRTEGAAERTGRGDGHDKRGTSGMTHSVMPDGFNRASRSFLFFR